MKAKRLVWILLLAGVAVVKLPAQTLQTLVSFNVTNGACPYAGLTLGTDGNFYGTTDEGGITNSTYPGGMGTVFMVTTNGTLTTLVSFNVSNGAYPEALTLGNDGNFYGTTGCGGDTNLNDGYGVGTVFMVTINGTLTTLVSFNNTNGAYPQAALTLGTDGNFYGTTALGGITNSTDPGGMGTVFMVTTNGTLTTLVSFNYTDGAWPLAALTLGTDGNFYGTTSGGGITNSPYFDSMGTVFKVTTNGTLTTLVSFNNTNGAYPLAALTLGTDGNFYGTTEEGGSSGYGCGTVFKVTTNGAFTTLVSFNYTDGAYPYAALTLGTDGNFYGTTALGGNYGTVFKMTTNGTLTTLVSFNVSNGAWPYAALTLGTDGNFYGTTDEGGITNSTYPYGMGTVFRLLICPAITVQPQNQAQVLGEDATFIVFAFSPAPLAYQWYFSNPALQTTAGATAQMLYGFVYGTIVTNGGSDYTTLPQVQFIGGGGSGASGTAAVSNGQVTAITMTNAGSGYTSPPAVLIDPPNLLSGQTNEFLNLNAITTNNLGSYYVVISNFYGSITSSVATLTIAYPPCITQQPTNQTVSFGSGANFNVTADGTPPLSYQGWMVAGQQTNATALPVVINGFVLTATITSGGAGYLAVPSVQFIGGSGSGAIGTAVVSNRMVTAINMSNAGSGYFTPPTIQIDAPTAISLTGQTNSDLSLAAVTFANAGNYFVVVSNYYGSVTSSPAALTITGTAFIPPQMMTLTASGGGLQLQFIGTPYYPYILETATNLALPINWQPVLTNAADASGNWSFTVTNTQDVPARFYRAAGQ